MKTIRLKYVFLFTLLTTLAIGTVIAGSSGQAGARRGQLGGAPPTRGKPFLDFRAPLPKEVTARKLRTTRQAGPAQTADLTPNTPQVTDSNPHIPKSQNAINELPIVFQSNRSNITGTAAGNLFHIYRMNGDGSGVVALTGPLSQGTIGAATSQIEPAFNATASTVVYVEADAGGARLDVVELDLSTRVTKSLVRNNVNFSFTEVANPEYGIVPGGNLGVIFSGRANGVAGGHHIYAVDTQSGVVRQMTGGNCDDRNPTLSPDSQRKVIAFDSDRANAAGSGSKPTRDIWVVGGDHDLPTAPSPPRQVTASTVNGQPVNNVQPTWSTNKPDLTGGQPIVRGQQLMAFATTRVDSDNDGQPEGVNSNGSHDIYWLKLNIVQSGTTYTVVNPVTGSTPVEDPSSNPALALNTSDPTHIYDDRHPAWPQFITSYRVVFDSNRAMYNQVTGQSGPVTPNQRDIFASTLFDINAPTLVRFNAATGDVVEVAPRIAVPGSTVQISAKVADLETGVRDVWVQIKNPNSKYQSADGLEHKVYTFGLLTPDGANSVINVPIEYESEAIFIGNDPSDPRFNTYPRRPSPQPTGPGVNRAAPPVYTAGIDDEFAFSGRANNPIRRGGPPPAGSPANDTGWLQLQPVPNSRDAEGAVTYTASWQTPSNPSDYYLDVIVYDNALNPFSISPLDAAVNWKIYDNVWGFTTATFNPTRNILFVSDHAAGQKFFNSRFGSSGPVNVLHTFWGSESWMTDIDVGLHPTQYDIPGSPPGTVLNHQNTLGVDSYRDGLTFDGTIVDGNPLPATQQYDLWRVLCRGPVPDAVLMQYSPRFEQQPPDVGETTPRNVLVANRCVIWHAPFVGQLFSGPGSLGDISVQSQLTSFVQSGGRILVNGEDIGWALTLDGAFQNPFYTNVLRAQFVVDSEPNTLYRIPSTNFLFPQYLVSLDNSYEIQGKPDYNPITADPWHTPGKNLGSPNHTYPGPPIPPDYHPIRADNQFVAGGTVPGSPGNIRTYSSPSAVWPDHMNPVGGAISDFNYRAGAGASAALHYADATTNGRVVYAAMGIEGMSDHAHGRGTNTIMIEPRKNQFVHNAVCWLRTGSIVGTVIDTEGTRVARALVRLGNTVDPNGRLITKYTALTRDDGSFEVNGVEPDIYEITAVAAGFTAQRRTFVTTHGGYRDNTTFLMIRAEPANITGKITRLDGTTPIPGATVTATSNDPNNPLTLTGVSDINGNYVIERVPAGITYTLTVTGYPAGFGPPSTPVSYQVPNPNDPITGQRDTVVQPAKSYTGFDFRLKPIPGRVVGRVVDANTNAGISSAVVTATQGSVVTTVIADANGVYTFDTLDPGSASIVAAAPGYVTSQAVTVTVQSGATIDTTTNPELRIPLTPAAPGTIRGLVVRNTDGQPVAGVTLSLLDPAGNTVATTTSFTPVRVANGQQYNFEFTNVPSGVRYTIRARIPGFTPIPGEITTTNPLPAGGAIDGINFTLDPLHTFPAALSLVSAPFDYPNSDVGDLLSIPQADRLNQNRFKFATWDLGRYVFYPTPPANTFRIGRGYFLGYVTNMALSQEGTPANPNLPFDITLNPGWNMIGNPFWKDASGQDIVIDWLKVDVVLPGGAVVTHDQAVAQGLISNALYGYVAGTYALEFSIQPWRGYWVRAFQNVTLRIDPNNDRLNRSVSIKEPVTRAAVMGGEGWTVNLRMSAGALRDEANFLGVSSRAIDGYDRYKAEKPPIFSQEYAYLTFDHDNWGDKSGGYGVDVRSGGLATKVWEVTARTSVVNATASIGWPDAAAAPRNVQLTLTDLATGAKRDMRTSSSYQWNTGDQPSSRRFRIEATGTAINYGLRITGVLGRNVGRSAGVAISYNLSAPADVEVRILGGTGAVVRKLTSRSTRSAGLNQATWDQKNDAGVAMPAGAYVVEIRAQSADGRQSVRAAQPILVTR